MLAQLSFYRQNAGCHEMQWWCALTLPELGQKWIMSQEADIFGMVVSFVVSLCLLFGLPWMDAFQNAQAPVQRPVTCMQLMAEGCIEVLQMQ